MSTHRHYTASALVFGTDDRVLLIDHVKSGLWLPPGGHIEPGETPAEAAVREVREETGVEARIITGPVFEHPAVTSHTPPLMIIEATAADPVNGPHQHIDFLYACRAAGGDELQLAAGEVTGARWAALADLDSLAVPAELPELVMHALAWVSMFGRDVPALRTPAGGLLVAMVTSNPAKAATAREHLASYGITVEHVPLQLEEIQAASVGEVALHKARQAHAALGRPVITEDSGFCIEELDGFPGPLAKPVTSMLGLAGIIQLADMTATRTAHFESALAYIDSAGARTLTSTGPSGTIAHRPAAATRAGAWSPLWDIWIPPGATQPVSAFGDREFSDYLAAWRGRSVFTQLGAWLQARQEQTR
jgi:non-canonical purine NTP pyrophosphatase (RdgB/HAM1 family)